MELFSLGDLHISDFVETQDNGKYDLTLVLRDGHVRLAQTVDNSLMFGRYWYRSGITDTMQKELADIVNSITKIYKTNKNDVWLDIACNDGTLLKNVPKHMIRVGIDPVEEARISKARENSDAIVNDYFNESNYDSTGLDRARIITTIAMFFDLDKPEDFIRNVHGVLQDDGLWVLQMSYLPLMLEQLAFDNICHEHVYYYALTDIKKLMRENGFNIVDAQVNDVNGGSFRIYCMKDTADITKFGTQPHRDVCNFRINSMLEYEKTLKLYDLETWENYQTKVNELRCRILNFITAEKKKGKTIWGYGASTKGNTLLQYFGLTNEHIDGIAERSEFKYGLRTVGTDIPIFSEDEMREAKPDYLLVLPWHFINEFIDREKDFLANGGKFLVPCPEFEVIGDGGRSYVV